MAEVAKDEGVELNEVPASPEVYINQGWDAEIERCLEENEELSATNEGNVELLSNFTRYMNLVSQG